MTRLTRRAFITAAGSRSHRAAPRLCRVPRAADHGDRAVCGGRSGRHHHAPDFECDGEEARPADRHRCARRRRRHDRREGGRERRARRSHADDGRDQQFRHQPVHVSENEFRSADRVRADHQGRGCAVGDVHEPVGAGEDARRVRRLCEGQSRQAQLFVAERWHHAASRGRAAEAADRHRTGACAVSRRAAGDAGADHQRCAALSRRLGRRPGLRGIRQGEGAGGRLGQAAAQCPGRADGKRKRRTGLCR